MIGTACRTARQATLPSMPPCLACYLTSVSALLCAAPTVRPLQRSFSRLASESIAASPRPIRRKRVLIRSASTATLRRPALGPELPALHYQVLTLLHQTTSLLPRVLPTSDQSGHTVESLEFWNELLVQAYDDIAVSNLTDAVRVVVFALDHWSGAQDLVTALLEEPLTSDNSQNAALRSRWEDNQGGGLIIQHGYSVKKDGLTLKLPSSYLAQFPAPIQITELPPPSTRSSKKGLPMSTRVLEKDTLDILFRADIPIIVCNPIVNPVDTLRQFNLPTNNPNTVIVLVSTSSLPPLVSENFQAVHSTPADLTVPVTLLAVDPARALQGLHTIQSSGNSALAVQRFQDDYVGSKISTITDVLKRILPAPTTTDKSPSAAVRMCTAIAHIRGALAACYASLENEKWESSAISMGVSELQGRIEEARAKVEGEVLGVKSQGSNDQDGELAISQALRDADKELRAVLDSLTWLRLLWRVDDISHIVGTAIEKKWCQDLEQQLLFHTGRLSTAQQAFTSSAFNLLALLPKVSSSLNPVLLRNKLQQLSIAPSYALTTCSLTTPIHACRAKIIQYSTARLQLAGQRAVLSMGGGVAAGVSVGWTGWVGWLAGTDSLLSLGVDGTTVFGLGVLGALAAVRWAVGTWERAKKRWWDDYRRVGEGLERDLKITLKNTFDKNVVLVAENSCHDLLESVSKHNEEIAVIQDELDKLRNSLANIEQSPEQ